MKQTALVKRGEGGADLFALGAGLADYGVLKSRVGEIFIEGRRRVERELIRMRYHTGLLINEHIRLNSGRAEYGTKALGRLEKDFDVDESELRRYAVFARSYPIQGRGPELKLNLPWRIYRKLIAIGDEAKRWALTAQAEKEEWSFETAEARVAYLTAQDKDEDAPPRLPFISVGPFFTYKVIRVASLDAPSGELLLDLGFKHRLELGLFFAKMRKTNPSSGGKSARASEGTIVTGDGSSFVLTKADGASDDCLYTYKAFVEAVVDGDTLKLDFFPGFGNRKGETIRLNHINCPELDTPEGKAAKSFVERELAGCGFLTVKSVRTRKEKWGRYLADVFYARRGKGPLVYLNQLLLDRGHAVRVRN
jgi:micrococcal nuclease